MHWTRFTNPTTLLYSLILIFLPTELGRHFWPQFTSVQGIRVDYLSPTLYFTDILILSLIILTVVNKNQMFFISSQIRSNLKFYSAALIFLLINIFLSKNPGLALYGGVRIVELTYLALYTMYMASINYRLFIPLLSFGVIWESILVFFQFHNQRAIGGLFYYVGERMISAETPGAANASINHILLLRPFGTFSHPNQLAGYLLICLILILFRNKINEDIKVRIYYSLALIAGMLGILLSFSRAAILLLIFIFIIHFGKNKVFKYIQQSIFILSTLLLIIIIGLVLGVQYRFLGFSLSDQSIIERQVLLTSTYHMILDHIIFGVGILHFIPTLPSYITGSTYLYFLQPVHNIFLLITAEFGVIGITGYFYLIYKTLQHLTQVNSKSEQLIVAPIGLIIAILVIQLIGFEDHYFYTLYQTEMLFIIIIGLSFGLINSNSKR